MLSVFTEDNGNDSASVRLLTVVTVNLAVNV